MKQQKKTKLALSSETVRSLSKVDTDRLAGVVGGSLIHTKVNSGCAYTNTCNDTCSN